MGSPFTTCASDMYKATSGTGSCPACPTGKTSVPGETSSAGCDDLCGAGSTWPAGGPRSLCVAGTYKAGVGTAPCSGCPANSAAPEGSISIDSCGCDCGFIGSGGSCTACQAGRQKTGTCTTATCVACEAGKYKATTGCGTCLACPADSYSPQERFWYRRAFATLVSVGQTDKHVHHVRWVHINLEQVRLRAPIAQLVHPLSLAAL